jgi:PIN domain nuclease of toxin-antitoxin system
MRLLLDTHVFLWWVSDDPKLSKVARELIYDTENIKYVSAATAWELAIKAGLGKIKLGQPVSDFFATYTADNGFEVLPILIDHLYLTETLPTCHKDPFDRLLVAQAKVEGLQLISADSVFDGYDIKRHW